MASVLLHLQRSAFIDAEGAAALPHSRQLCQCVLEAANEGLQESQVRQSQNKEGKFGWAILLQMDP
eukprot:1154611-Pelagomonas_calceolata.AAC.1